MLNSFRTRVVVDVVVKLPASLLINLPFSLEWERALRRDKSKGKVE